MATALPDLHKRTRFGHVKFACLLSALFALALFCAAGTFPQYTYAKSYVIDSVKIRAELSDSGAMSVNEKRTFNFDGDFSYVYWDFPVDTGQQINFTGLSVTDESGKTTTLTQSDAPEQQGSFYLENNGDSYRLTAFMPASNEKLTYSLSYDESNVVKHYEDAAELYWQFIGKSWGVRTKQVDISIAPPETLTKAQVKAWAHGPLNGLVSIENNGDVTLSVSDLPANTFVEARALYPADAFSAAPLTDGTITNTVLSEEQQWADEANSQRKATRLRYYGFTALGILGGIILFGIVIWLFFKYGREHKTYIPFEGKYWREDPRPDLPPAMIGCLWRFGEVKTEDITATILDLADRKVILMEEKSSEKKRLIGAPKIEKEYSFKVDLEKLEKEPIINQDLVKLLIKTGWSSSEFSFDSINAYAKKSPADFAESLNAWKASVKGQVEIANLIEAASNTAQTIAAILSAALFILGIVMFFQSCTFAGVFCVVLSVPSAILTLFMKRRSAEGSELFHRYEGLKNYLQDFSRLDEVPPTSIVVWNRFLVLAIIFGIADQVSKNLKATLPDMVASDDFAISYWWFFGPGLHTSPINNFNSVMSSASAAAIAASAASSGAGLGGGFSGGGGFGGGGGGGGAG